MFLWQEMQTGQGHLTFLLRELPGFGRNFNRQVEKVHLSDLPVQD
jgi:hypothetical protein